MVIDILKTSQSSVCDLATDSDEPAIACAVISLAHSPEKLVIAQGVGTEAQLSMSASS